MKKARVAANLYLYNGLMDVVAKSAASGEADLLDGRSVIKRMRNDGLVPDTVSYNILLETCANCALKGKATLKDGLAVIQSMRTDNVPRDAITYNTLLDLLSKETSARAASRVAEGRSLLSVMRADKVQPDLYTFSALIDVCAKAAEHGLADINDADGVLALIKESGIVELDKVICNAYLNCAKADGSEGALDASEKMLEIMPQDQRDSYTYSCMISLYGKTGKLKKAREMFVESRANLPKANAYVYNAMMGAEAAQGNFEEVLELWGDMKAKRIRGDDVTESLVGDAGDALNRSPYGPSL
eukprot:CAMPEP_0206213794 /NCGR_PEP_ID=MMETSP0047_2-20121206/1310_1 /ASSEMBLY_ACC=CAM_ASM_000192 /TAXON_ID=195065 /ORGANISM="Chroomonas mesostigmatica_cf, Strain CCMP1168" /LENGTH=300 /DNA_ID=CAMNT_0053635963 /DNA_START=63 /DNA_END=965 /DNA_ORIENTATION=-